MLDHGVLVQGCLGWGGVGGVVLVLCTSLSLLNASYFFLVRTLSMEWPVVVRCCRRDLSGIVDTPFSDCAVLVVRT